MANILNVGTDKLTANEHRDKHRYKYGQRNIDNRKQQTRAQHNFNVLNHNYDSVFNSYVKTGSEANENENFSGFEKQDDHIISIQGKREKSIYYNDGVEDRTYIPDIGKAKVQTPSKVEESIAEFALSAIPEEVKAPVLEETASLVQDIFVAVQNNIPLVEVLEQKLETLRRKGGVVFVGEPRPAETGQAPDLSEIPRWQSRKQDGMPLDFIKAHYGQWLSSFGAQEDTVFQDQIRKHDKRLITAIENQFRQERQGRKVRDFLKPRSARTDREVEAFTSDSLKHAERLAAAKRRRQTKRQSFPRPSSQ